jgi:hypothetical protein
VVLLAKSAATLDRAISVLLRLLVVTFGNLHLTINWEPGKTEALLCYRGHGAVAAREQWRTPDGKLKIPVPDSHGKFLNIVEHYKHLGTFCSVRAETYRNTAHRVQSAMSAYGPLSMKIFGNSLISVCHRLSFLRSLVLSRLLYNVYICATAARDYIAYNSVYMRALRRIAGDPRFSADTQYTDLQIRAILKAPSIDCVIAKMRLAYLGRIVRLRPRALLGLLHLRKGDVRLPWVREVAKDCDRLRMNDVLPSSFPSFLDSPAEWYVLILDEPAWKKLLDSLFFIESVTDRHVDVKHDDGCSLAYRCSRCSRAFASQKALESHRRAKHGDRLDIRRYVRTPVCPCCGTDYRERLRCIAHLSDKRRPGCADWVRGSVVPMPDPEVKRLDEIDKVLRTETSWMGRSTHIAKQPARRSDGRVVGRISA